MMLSLYKIVVKLIVVTEDNKILLLYIIILWKEKEALIYRSRMYQSFLLSLRVWKNISVYIEILFF